MNLTSTLGSPNTLLDYVIDKLDLKNDADLASRLEVDPGMISRIRHGKLPVGATILVRIHEETGDNIRYLKQLAGTKK